jgi:Methyltransferase domain
MVFFRRSEAQGHPVNLTIEISGSPGLDRSTRLLHKAFSRATKGKSRLSDAVLGMPGMSGRRYRMFINDLVRHVPDARYLEVGTWAGSTACAAMEGNRVSMLCIDDWSQFGGPKDAFLKHIEMFRNDAVHFDFIETDFRNVDASKIGRFNIYLFDGPHDERDQYDGLCLFAPALEDDVFFIVDDWNWSGVRRGTRNAIHDCGFEIDYAIELRTSVDDSSPATLNAASDWHNGYFLSKLSRRKTR